MFPTPIGPSCLLQIKEAAKKIAYAEAEASVGQVHVFAYEKRSEASTVYMVYVHQKQHAQRIVEYSKE
jgi:hypothetical protein